MLCPVWLGGIIALKGNRGGRLFMRKLRGKVSSRVAKASQVGKCAIGGRKSDPIAGTASAKSTPARHAKNQ